MLYHSFIFFFLVVWSSVSWANFEYIQLSGVLLSILLSESIFYGDHTELIFINKRFRALNPIPFLLPFLWFLINYKASKWIFFWNFLNRCWTHHKSLFNMHTDTGRPTVTHTHTHKPATPQSVVFLICKWNPRNEIIPIQNIVCNINCVVRSQHSNRYINQREQFV